jgi:hypothetical protein
MEQIVMIRYSKRGYDLRNSAELAAGPLSLSLSQPKLKA